MKYQELVNVYEDVAATTKRLEKTKILADYFARLEGDLIEMSVLLASGKVFSNVSEEEQGVGAKLLMKAIAKAVGVSVDVVEDQLRDQGDIGAAAEYLYKRKSQMTFFTQPLTIGKVYNNLRKVADISGNRAQSRKINLIIELLSSASAVEAKYIARTTLEELRIGVGEGVLRDAIAQAYNCDPGLCERAHMLTNDLGLVANVAYFEGDEGLKNLSLKPGKPVKPMLAQLSEGIEFTINEMGYVLCETKYDGIRVQIHKDGEDINVFTRRLENISRAVPEVVDYVREAFDDVDFICEGEIIVTKDGRPISFQQILRRVRRKYDVEQAIEEVPLTLYLFDLLYYEVSLIDEPLEYRRKKLEEVVTLHDKVHLSKHLWASPDNVDEAIKLFNDSLSAGHEGIMLKNPREPYIPGIRGKKMMKFKAEPETLDMVVVGGTYGIGKRANFIGSYEVALRDDEGGLKTTAHVATGLDDDTLEKLTQRMKEIIINEKGTLVEVEPKIILEIAYSEIVKSPEYEAGYSLRFPVVKRIRDDISISDVDSVTRLISIFNNNEKR